MDTPPLRRDAQRNRQLLLDTAHALMARNGLGVSYEDIARTAGTGMGTVYRRFPEREDLMNALFAEHIDTVVDLARQAALTEDPWEGLCWFMTHQLELEADNRGLGELLRSGNQAPDLVARGRDEITPLAARLLTRAIDAGQLPPSVTPTDLVAVHLMVGAVMDAAREVDPQMWRRALTIALAGLRTAELPIDSSDPHLIDGLYGVTPTSSKESE